MSRRDDARREVLERIARANAGVASAGAVARDYRGASGRDREAVLATFLERVRDYRVAARRVEAAALRSEIAAALEARGVRRLVCPAGLPAHWRPEGVDPIEEGDADNAALDASDGVISSCAVAIADTGTIVLDGGPGQGARRLTLLPDYHLCIVPAERVVDLVPEAIARFAAERAWERPLTFISGPSATSDIELDRVEGVHGPRTLEVLLLVDAG